MILECPERATRPDLLPAQAAGQFQAAVREPLLLLVVGAVFALHVCFAFQSRQVFSYDDSWYAEMSLRLLDSWSRDGLPGAYQSFMQAFGGIKAPLVILLPQPLLLLFGRHDYVFLLVNPICLVVASLYLAALARLLGVRRGIPLLVLIFSAMPLTVDTSRRFYVEMLITTLGLMFIYHGIQSERLTRRGHSLAAGMALGLGILSKVTFPLFVVGVGLLLLYEAVRRPVSWTRVVAVGFMAGLGPLMAVAGAGHWPHPVRVGLVISGALLLLLALRGTRQELNGAGALLLAFWIPLPWYLRNAPAIMNFAVSASVGELSLDYGSKEIFSLAAILRYWTNNLIFGIGILSLIGTVLIAVALVATGLVNRHVELESPSGSRAWRVLAVWVLPALIVFTLGRNRTTRFIMPLLPAAALFYGLLFDRLAARVRGLAWGAGGLCSLAALGSLVVYTFGGPSVQLGTGGRFMLAGPDLTSLSKLTKPPMPIAEIVAAAERVASPGLSQRPMAMFLTDAVHVNLNTSLYEAAKAGSPLLFGLVPYIKSAEKPLESLKRADILLYQEGGKDFSMISNRGGEVVLNLLRNGALPGWRVLPGPTVGLPDGGTVRFVERVRGSPSPALEPCLVRFGPYALISYSLARDAQGLQLVTCWQKQGHDDGHYAVAAHLTNGEDAWFVNIDHHPAAGPEAFARAAVGDVVVVSKQQPPGEWCQTAKYVEICLYDIKGQRGLPWTVIHGVESRPGEMPRLKLPPPESSIPPVSSAPAN